MVKDNSRSHGAPFSCFIAAASPDRLISFVADGPFDGENFYPHHADGVPILREVFAFSWKASHFLESEQDVFILKDGDLRDVFGYDVNWQGLQPMSNHLQVNTWEAFCYSMCIAYNLTVKKLVKTIEREKTEESYHLEVQESIDLKASEIQAKKAEESKKQMQKTLEMLGD